MGKKIFLPMEEVRDDAFKLAKQLQNASFNPTIIYAVMRGGSYIANPISEYLIYQEKLREVKGEKVTKLKYGVILGVQSYEDIGKRKEVKEVKFLPETSILTPNDKVLIVEDIIDEGKTIEAIVKKLEEETPLRLDHDQPLPERQILIVAHDVKVRTGEEKIMPDYYTKKWDLDVEEVWIFYTSHELIGMEKEEIREHYGPILK